MNNKKGTDLYFWLKKISHGIILTIIVFLGMFIYDKNMILGEALIYETIPCYTKTTNIKMLFKFSEPPYEVENITEIFKNESLEVSETSQKATEIPIKNEPETQEEPEIKDEPEVNNPAEESFVLDKIQEDINYNEEKNIIGLNNVIYQHEADTTNIENHFNEEYLTIEHLDKLRDVNYLKNKFYIVDKRTGLKPELFNIDKFISEDLHIDISNTLPKILIFHTHSNEKFINSTDSNEGVLSVGEALSNLLTNKYGIRALHDKSSYDIVEGKSSIIGAYERMEPKIKKILEDNPSIEVAIDIHRDGVNESIHLVENINEKPTAQIMFFNGLSTLNENGVLKNIESLPNNNLAANLAFSFHMQLAANKLYPGLTRKVYLNAYRYSLHMLPKSLLIEVGAQTNTKEEALNAVEPIARILSEVLLPK